MNTLLFGILTLFWGLSFIAIRVTLEAIPPFAGATLRVLIAGIFLVFLAYLRRTPRPMFSRHWKKLLLVGLFNFTIPWACLFWGQQYVYPAIASILNATVPIFVFILSWKLLSDEQPTRLKMMGMSLGFTGIFFMFWPSLSQLGGVQSGQMKGMLAIITMAASYALGSVGTKRWLKGISIQWSVAFQSLAAALVLGIFSMGTEGLSWIETALQNPRSFVAVSYLAIFSTALAWLIYGHLIFTWGAFRTSAVTYLVPLVAIAIDFFWLRNLPNFHEWVGTALIFSSLGLVHLARTKQVLPELKETRSAA